ncbi:flavin reductase family protein [Pandoraea fibrosis]|uniref:Flavin reductase n=1 Tax=Pandoraea fibrosis TaxID=1891094 RepID=A0A5E4W6T0_9BURK|nr:flavin reductase family protein [Pandoraea fibrosis]QHE90412.1 flavin reductase [Pandoraea fibrosis]QHF11244.1 flavin reductase [Pandoraea fibrosis]VVE19306.1 flavin reductase [Pandoraea fibrosis]
MISTVQVPDFQQAMASFPGGITAVTTHSTDGPIGIIATAVCSLSAEPPSILVCVHKHASVHDAILDAGCFAVNLLSTRHQALVARFSQQRGAARFEPALWAPLKTGAPTLSNAALTLDCTLLDTHDGYSHTIIVGAVAATKVGDTANAGCLLWHDRTFARSSPLAAY